MSRILVVDDDPMIVESLQETLAAEGLASVGAYDQASAEALIGIEFFPIILADLRLRTAEEGIGLLQLIQRSSPASAVITITGDADEVISMRLRDLGSRTVLVKPVDPNVLMALVREMLIEIDESAALLEDENVEVLYAAVTPQLRGLAYRRYGFSGEDADDLVQRAWLLYFEKRSSIRASRAWMSGTILNLCKQEIQQRYRRRAFDDGYDGPTETVSGADDARIAIGQALGVLDERGRELCVRIGLERQSYEEVSTAMNLPIGSIGPLFIRAKDRMRTQLMATGTN
jgi:RNA polymerase sigma factor (sigma-70 family)